MGLILDTCQSEVSEPKFPMKRIKLPTYDPLWVCGENSEWCDVLTTFVVTLCVKHGILLDVSLSNLS